MQAPPAAQQGAAECTSTASCAPGATSPAFSARGRAWRSSAASILPGSSLNISCAASCSNQTSVVQGALTPPNHSAATLKDTLRSCLLDVEIHHLAAPDRRGCRTLIIPPVGEHDRRIHVGIRFFKRI